MATKSPTRKESIIVAALGLLLIIIYFVLTQAHVGRFGADTDIGGGFLLVAGIAVTIAGLVLFVISGSSKREH